MNLYQVKAKSLPQKLFITGIELGLIVLSGYLMFGWFAADPPSAIPTRRWVILGFSLITLLRFVFMMFFLLRRAMPWSEVIAVPLAFSIYYLGFAALGLSNQTELGIWDEGGVVLFLLGSGLNTYSELQRDRFKQDPVNKGKLYTGGLFAYAMHINFFGDVLWVAGYAVIAGHLVGIGVVLLLLLFFMFKNVPMLDDYLRDRYGKCF